MSSNVSSVSEPKTVHAETRVPQGVAGRYDVVVCGAGTSGCVVAGRLAADPRISVLLLEAGGSDDVDLVRDPNLWPMTLGTDLDWNLEVDPDPRLAGRAIPYGMGRVLGGGSSINVSTWSRGHRSDWDAYAAAARDPVWGYASVLDLYRHKVEAWNGDADLDFRGLNGTVPVRPSQHVRPFSRALLEGAASLGLPTFPSPNGLMMEVDGGGAIVDETIQGGERRSIYRSYVHPLGHMPNLTVVTGATVTTVTFDGRRATGVRFRREGADLAVAATHQVVLSLGAIHTPKVLMASGIGGEEELDPAGIPILQALPGVGRALHDHVAVGLVWEGMAEALPRIPRAQTVCFWKTTRELDGPDAYCYARAGAAISPENATEVEEPPNAWSLVLGVRLKGRGSVRLTGSDPSDPVRIAPGYLSDPDDMDTVRAAFRFAREIGNTSALRSFRVREVTPDGGDCERLDRFLRQGLGTFWHQSGTARMGYDPLSVVDGRLRVHGLDNLRVADSSILPRVTSGNTMAPCVVVGEQAARFIADDLRI